jgi:hypothetical protein
MRVVLLALLVSLAVVVPQAGAATDSHVLVAFRQSGGLAGVKRGLVVYRSGKVASNGLALTTSQLGPARLRALRTALVQARFATLDDRYEPDEPIADGFVYTIGYAGRTVTIDEGAKPPPRLARVFALLRRLVER